MIMLNMVNENFYLEQGKERDTSTTKTSRIMQTNGMQEMKLSQNPQRRAETESSEQLN